jgi:HK97 family phage prohead protease
MKYEEKMKNREYRNVQSMETREEGMIAEGYATTFNDPYLLYSEPGFEIYEEVDSHAFDDCDMSDVIMQYDHMGRVFARNKNNTLTCEPDEKGLHIRADLSGTDIGRQLYQEIKGGYTDKMSYGYTVRKDERREVYDRDTDTTRIYRTVLEIAKLYDVSAVSLPANEGTSISARNYCDGVIAEVKAERQRAEERKAEIDRIKLLIEV